MYNEDKFYQMRIGTRQTKKKNSSRFTMTNELFKRSATRNMKENKHAKLLNGTYTKSLKNISAYEMDENSDSSEFNNVNEINDSSQLKRAVPFLNLKEGLLLNLENSEAINEQYQRNIKQVSQQQKVQWLQECNGDEISNGMENDRSFYSQNSKIENNFPITDKIVENHSQSNNSSLLTNIEPKIINKYNRLFERNPFIDPYYVVLIPIHNINRLIFELNNYNDSRRFLRFRKYVVYLLIAIPMFFQIIVDSKLFKFLNGVQIICNVTFYMLSNSNPPIVNESYKTFILYCEIIEIIIRVMATGIIYPTFHFINSKEDIFNLFFTAISFIHFINSNYIPFDPTPLRIITILLYFGDVLLRVKYMLIALKKSLGFLSEALLILIILTLFFSINGVYLFQGLFNYNCQSQIENNQNDWIQCYQSECPQNYQCKYTSQTPTISTSFNNIIYSYGQILRTITMDDWSWVMFFTMRIFHPYIWIYYLIIIFVCGFFSINLMIAVLKIHYSEATDECQEFERQQQMKKDSKNILKDQQFQIDRDIITSFDVSFLRYIGFYEVIKQYWTLQACNQEQYIIDSNFKPERSGSQLRFLSSKQQNLLDEALQKHKKKTFLQKFKNFSIKTFLLKKFKNLQKLQNNINIKNFSDDPLEISVLLKLTEYNFSSLQKQVNYEIKQKFKSSKDVIMKKKRKKLQNIEKLKMIYKPMLNEQDRRLSQKSFTNIQFFKYPILKSSRKISIQKFYTNESIETPIRQVRSRQDAQATINFSQQKVQNQPFEKIENHKKLLHIQGYYIDYEEIQDKINQKIQKNKQFTQLNEDKYLQIIKQEKQQQIIQYNNWSGNNVLNLNYKRLQQFEDIFNNLNNVNSLIWMPTFTGKLLILRKYSCTLINSKLTQLFFDIVILVNFIFLSLYGILNSFYISKCEDICTIILLVEVGLQLFSYPIKQLLSKKEYLIQILIMTISFIEFAFSDYLNMSDQYLRLIRGTKCILFFRCLKYNEMAVLIGKIATITFTQYIYLTIFMSLIIIIYALIGMDLYSGKFNQTDPLGQLHSFDDMPKAIMTIFNIMTNDDWYGVYVIGSNINQIEATLYSFSMVIILNYLTYGLVLAILLDGFGKYLDDKQITPFEQQDDQIENDKDSMHDEQAKSQLMTCINVIETQPQDEEDKPLKHDLIESVLESIKQLNIQMKKSNPKLYEDIYCYSSLFFFDKTNYIRIVCCKICQSTIWLWYTNLILILSIIVMIVETYHDFEKQRSSTPKLILTALNLALLIEDIISIIAKGLFIDKGSYLTYSWQIVDFLYIISFFINLITSHFLITFGLFLGHFRPMKLMYRIKWLDKMRAALSKSLFDLIKLLIVLLSVWIMFGVFGIILYESQFEFCNDKMQFGINYQECIQNGGNWMNYKHNFDNITIAVPTLFIISTFDGWGEIMQVAENSRPLGQGPWPFYGYIQTYVYFISFCFIGSMFFLSFFTGTLFSKLRINQQKIEEINLTKSQQEFLEISPIILKDTPNFSMPPRNIIRKFASFITGSPISSKFMFLILLIDLICQIQYSSEMTLEYLFTINQIQRYLIIFYLLWIFLLFLNLGINRFFDDLWRKYYIILFIISFTDLITDLQYNWVEQWFVSNIYSNYYQLLRLAFMLRSFRLLVIFQGFSNLKRLIRVMGFAFPFLLKLISILIITMIIYALIGCQLFGEIQEGAVIDDYINFTTFENALLALFKCASGDDFRTIMTDTMHHNPYCPQNPYDCGSDFNQLYFITFMLFSNYVLLNLFILALIEQFEEFYQLQNSMIQTYVEQIDKIKTVWCKYSAHSKGESMHYKFLCKFLLDIGNPLGCDKSDNLWDAAKLASHFNLRCDLFGQVQYNQLLYQLFRNCYHEQVFKQGTQESISKLKTFNKEMQFRLVYYRRNKGTQRAPINVSSLEQKSNFNILHDYLNVLILYKTWQTYTQLLFVKVTRHASVFTENDELTIQQNLDNRPTYWRKVQGDYSNDLFYQKKKTTDMGNDIEYSHPVSRVSEERIVNQQIPIYTTTLQQDTDRIFGGFGENDTLNYKNTSVININL